MATATLDTFYGPVQKLGVEYIDAQGNIGTTTSTVKKVPTEALPDAAAVGALATLIDPLTNCRICEVMVDSNAYTMTANDAAISTGHYYTTFDELVLTFRSQTRCREKISFSILGPIDAVFTGNQKIMVDKNQTDVAALITWLEANLSSKNYGGLTNFKYVSGKRVSHALPEPNVN